MISDTAFSKKVLLIGKSLCSKSLSKLTATCKCCTIGGPWKFSSPLKVWYVPEFIEGCNIIFLRKCANLAWRKRTSTLRWLFRTLLNSIGKKSWKKLSILRHFENPQKLWIISNFSLHRDILVYAVLCT